jgi:hypothetical protein
MNQLTTKLVVAALLSVTMLPTPALGWGRLGHRLIGHVAADRLSPSARLAVTSILEPGESLADASTWADEHKRSIAGSGAWHYVDIPLDHPEYDPRFAGEDPSMGAIVPRLKYFSSVLEDATIPLEDRRVALRFVIHLMGDLHQPLHVGDNHDRGGNQTQVRLYNRGTNMHKLWDFNMIELVSDSEPEWLQILGPRRMTEAQAQTWALRGSIEDWATESLVAARAAYQDPETGERIGPGQWLGDAYIEANLPVVRDRLYLSGVRLAGTLNRIFVAPDVDQSASNQ